MKKYVKPQLFYERFELSQHVANCDWELLSASSTVCSAKPDSVTKPGVTSNLFTNQVLTCEYIPLELEGGNYDGIICYHQGTSNENVFQS